MSRYPFSPRFKIIAYAGLALGAVAISGAIFSGGISGWIIGALCLGSGAAYLLSPTWRLAIETNDNGLKVFQRDKLRFALPWTDVARLLVMPNDKAAFIDGGTPSQSVLVPGPGAQAGYLIADREALIQEVRDRIPSERVKNVEDLRPDPKPSHD